MSYRNNNDRSMQNKSRSFIQRPHTDTRINSFDVVSNVINSISGEDIQRPSTEMSSIPSASNPTGRPGHSTYSKNIDHRPPPISTRLENHSGISGTANSGKVVQHDKYNKPPVNDLPARANHSNSFNKFKNENSFKQSWQNKQSNNLSSGPIDTNKNKYHNPNKFNDQQNHENDNDYLDDIETKRQLIEYVYGSIQLSEYKYKLIEYEYDLPLLKEKSYFVSPNYNGIHSLLIFIKIKDKFLSFIIDRKTLTYNIRQIDYNKVKMIPIFFSLDKEIYDGTIFDGVFLYNNINGLKHFVINDIYYLRGKNMSNDKITNKILNITTYLETIKQNTTINNIVFIINKLYPLNEIQQLVNLYIPKSKYNKSIKGISFYPEFSGTKLIYLYNNCSNENKSDDTTQHINRSNQAGPSPILKTDTVIKERVNQSIASNIAVSSVGTNNVTTGVFKMKKTETIDVYNLFLGQKLIEGDKKMFKYKKIGIAYVPTRECSTFCKNAFLEANGDEILVDCKLDSDKNRWIPYKVNTTKKRPDLLQILDVYFKNE